MKSVKCKISKVPLTILMRQEWFSLIFHFPFSIFNLNDPDWNRVRLTARGFDEPTASFSFKPTPDGSTITLR